MRRRLWTAQQLQDLQRQEQQQKQKAAAQQQAMQQQAKDSGATAPHNQQQQQQQRADGNQNDDDADAEEAAEEVAKAEQLLQQQYSDQALQSKLAALDRHIGIIYAALPANALLIVATGHGDMPELRRQQEMKYKREQRLDGMRPWSTADEEAFCRVMEQQMRTLCFCAVKR
jgi:hypothetical protein